MSAVIDLSRIAGTSVADRLESLRAEVSGRIVFTTSFGLEDQALAHLIFHGRLDIDVVTLDSGRLFPSTYQLWANTEARYNRSIRSYHPEAQALSGLLDDIGINGFYYSRDARSACCGVRKVEPLARALDGAAAWVTGLRASQSGQRGAVELVAWDAERGMIKVSPLFDKSRDDVAAFCAEHDVPVNPLHAKGFLSIGCQPCTRAVKPGEPERAGRWWWEDDAAKECGLHVAGDGRLVRAREAA